MVADLVICGIELPFIIYGTVLGRWDLPYILCSVIGVLLYFAAGTSLRLSVVIAFNRLLGCFPESRVCQKLSEAKKATRNMAIPYITYVICWAPDTVHIN